MSQRFEDFFERKLSRKNRKDFLASVGPFLLVVTFLEDGLRIFMRWEEQIHYMTSVMGLCGSLAQPAPPLPGSLCPCNIVQTVGLWCLLLDPLRDYPAWCQSSGQPVARGLAAPQVVINTASLWVPYVRLRCIQVIRPSTFKPNRVKPGCYGLLFFVAVQPFMYGQARDVDFMCRSITLAGGLLLLIWSENDKQRRNENVGLPQDAQGQGADRLQLCGRFFLTFIFFFQAIYDEHGGLHKAFTKPSFLGICASLLLLVLSGLVCAGFKTEWSALLLVAILSVSNCFMYPFWSVHDRLVDFYKYYFFQTLSVMGGMMLLALHGPGGISLDKGAKKSI